MAEGSSLREICRDNGMPKSTFRQWIRDDRDGLAARYQASRVLQVESWSDQILELANRDDLEPNDKRVRVDALKWLMSKLVPKKWGERLLVAGDAESPLQIMHKQADLAALTEAQLAGLERFTKTMIIAE
jgi:transposase-like protein